ncbi:MAG TPA: hypothetical protein GX696_11635, partial [Pseudomonadaceae bacterium]|nr:hypothetical protein [Pseudomonadaceae bacterium]
MEDIVLRGLTFFRLESSEVAYLLVALCLMVLTTLLVHFLLHRVVFRVLAHKRD